jgi:hypothetical protein
MPTLLRPKPVRRSKAAKKTVTPVKKPFRFELTPEDFALDNAISAAAARSLASRRT